MASADQVDMHVENRLSGHRTHIKHRPITFFDPALAGNSRGSQMAGTDDSGVRRLRFLQPANVFFRNNQDVGGRLRINVFEGKNLIVLVNFLCRNLSANYAAK